MLSLKNITKVYPAAGEDVHALRGLSLDFRKSEFVSILGPSGCGKTTLLNIIGGLDRYTDGDLVIEGRSTKEYKDRDWDTYRNHSVGFVFQTYNLIPHQSVLQNVELALTLAGVGKRERRERARIALEKVGLGDQLKKKPSEMSGGQMQRVAIARAIVNDPEIILADEPTGALDSETSIQVLDILKEIAADRLVIMVTHNPDLAERYSTRIVRILDGRILSDSLPVSPEELAAEDEARAAAPAVTKKRPSMKAATSFGLSLKNLFTKKGRTILTSFAGSIGIIGIALIYAVSQGTTNYIDSVQEQTLTSYPITIEAQTLDMSSFISTFMGRAKSLSEHEDDAVYQKAMFYEMVNAMTQIEARKNDLKAFKVWLEEEKAKEGSDLSKALAGIQYGYGLNLQIYTKGVDGELLLSDTTDITMRAMQKYGGPDFSAMMALREQSAFGGVSSSMESNMSLWKELLPGEGGAPVSEVTKEQYELLYGSWPSAHNEIILFVDDHNELSDLTLFAMGLRPEADIEALIEAAMHQKTVEYDDTKKWSYEEICALDYRSVLPSDCYAYDEASGTWLDLRDSSAGLQFLYDNALKLKVTGIAKVNKDAVSGREYGSIGYTHLLTEYLITHAAQSAAVKAQKADPGIDIFSGLPFKDNDVSKPEEKAAAFLKALEDFDEEKLADIYTRIMSIPDDETVAQTVAAQLAGLDRSAVEQQLAGAMASQMGMDAEAALSYIQAMSDEDFTAMAARLIEEQFRSRYAEQVRTQLAAMTPEQLAAMLRAALPALSEEQEAKYYDDVLEFADGNYDGNLVKLGCLELADPSRINLFASSFADKDTIEEAISGYNESVPEMQQIRYTDYVGLIMSSVTTIINAITYVLIAFVAVSLIVSSIMIGVITLISVQERTKEIGILRAIGASKKNVSSLFNAETVIIGFASGLLGVGITYLLTIPINAILYHFTDIEGLKAVLPLPVAGILVAISMLLTLIAGIIPSRSAAKKDPVVALRTE